MRFDAVFFDSGDTIFNYAGLGGIPDPTPQETDARRPARTAALLHAFGYHVSESLIAEKLAGLKGPLIQSLGHAYTHENLIQALYTTLGLPERPEEILCVTEAYSGPRYRSWLFPDVHDVLSQLRDAGVYVGLIANTDWPGWIMDRVFRGVGLSSFFGVRIYSGDEGIAKPDPRIFHLAAERSEFTGRRLLYVGNSIEADILGARDAGWPVVLFRSTDRTSNGLADFEIDAWRELPGLIL